MCYFTVKIIGKFANYFFLLFYYWARGPTAYAAFRRQALFSLIDISVFYYLCYSSYTCHNLSSLILPFTGHKLMPVLVVCSPPYSFVFPSVWLLGFCLYFISCSSEKTYILLLRHSFLFLTDRSVRKYFNNINNIKPAQYWNI